MCKEAAETLLREAELCNPGPWGNHSRVAAHCAERIALYCKDLDPDKAYILGLLHDIGRKFGVRHLGHVSDGYSYMMSLGYDEVARVCILYQEEEKVLEKILVACAEDWAKDGGCLIINPRLLMED